ncbi:Nucleosomal histone H3-Lys79 methylase [Maudiozyma exigua]|uniref:Histone-lysine N-methyltransferase, H3 lysine-79 specific n=1 Tax=Maudiozyma exigua TaxID=34358 RepID=A0A9P7BDI3_MAUEX|nr:Nucleosomal histone H3-Lys79 methylase [Kazachstania exigua]
MDSDMREDSVISNPSSTSSSIFSNSQKNVQVSMTHSPSANPKVEEDEKAAKKEHIKKVKKSAELQDILEDAHRYYSTYEYRMPKSSSKRSSDNHEEKTDYHKADDKITLKHETTTSSNLLKKRKKKTINDIQSIKTTEHVHTPKKYGRKYGHITKRSNKNKKDDNDDDEDYIPEDESISKMPAREVPHYQSSISTDLDESIKEVIEEEGDDDGPSSFIETDGPMIPVRRHFFNVQELFRNDKLHDIPIPAKALVNHKMGRNSVENPNQKIVKLQSVLYPDYQEEYKVCFEEDCELFNPMAEIGKLIEYTALIYLPAEYREKVNTDIIPILNEAFDNSNDELFIETVNNYNKIIKTIHRRDIIDHLCAITEMPVAFLHDFLHIVYTRSIHPDASKLRHYAAFSNYVYGELLPSFLTDVYDQCDLGPSKIFMDLGSGVDNCVLQAGLEYGCSLGLGCEIMPDASDLTLIQLKEFNARCKLMGFTVPQFEFRLRESFVDNPRVIELIAQCDVLLINNFLFDSKLNREVEKLLQHAKVGCKIISLKNLRSLGYTIDFYNIENILSRLQIKKQKFAENSVSWTHRGGEYYISTVLDEVDESLLSTSSRFRSSGRSVRYTR